MSGAGKSSLAAELGRRGLHAVDADTVLARWVDDAGKPAECPSEPAGRWRVSHFWHWDPDRLRALLADTTDTLFVCGNTENIEEFIPWLDLVILLEIDVSTMRRRLDEPTRDIDWGRSGDAQKALTDWAPGFQARMRRIGATVVDGRLPLATVADEVVRLAQNTVPQN
ncbi:hypothetical protein AB0E67_35150 [Streptomyces sp. NPDC032161]|uniref:hypothetical protein n=1 Tax=unclassified Streptomyces TaxID=2593676 RepID=UPI0033CBFC48